MIQVRMPNTKVSMIQVRMPNTKVSRECICRRSMIDDFHSIGTKLAWLIGSGQRARLGTEPWKKGTKCS